MKTVYPNRENQPIFLQNTTGEPEMVLIFPITRGGEGNSKKWQTVFDFFAESQIKILVVIDKTEERTATDFFLTNFELVNKRLLVLQRSIEDTLFDSVGEIVLDKNMWVIQTHDDDRWSGKITMPEVSNLETVYSYDFYLQSKTKGTIEIEDYSMPNRIVFSLVPSRIWNRFSKLVRDQNYHVAGSFDFTLNRMAQLTCKFEYQSGYEYHWKDDNWETSQSSIAHLTRLAESDGWKQWSSPEIANFNRSIDSLSSLNCLRDMLSPTVIKSEAIRIIDEFRPSPKRRLKYGILIPTLRTEIIFRRIFVSSFGISDRRSLKLQKRLNLYKFIKKTWHVKSIENLIDLIAKIEALNSFEKLQFRFKFWKLSLSELSEGF